jgi:hypothetical protein
VTALENLWPVGSTLTGDHPKNPPAISHNSTAKPVTANANITTAHTSPVVIRGTSRLAALDAVKAVEAGVVTGSIVAGGADQDIAVAVVAD